MISCDPKEVGADKPCLALLVLGSLESIQASQEAKGKPWGLCCKDESWGALAKSAGLGRGLAEKLRLPARLRSRKNCVETWVLVYA